MPEVMLGQPRLHRLRKVSDTPCWAARYTFADICGHSPALVHARELARRAAQAECAVLLLGESGTGKELFAQAIHRASPRQAGPFVPIVGNCGKRSACRRRRCRCWSSIAGRGTCGRW